MTSQHIDAMKPGDPRRIEVYQAALRAYLDTRRFGVPSAYAAACVAAVRAMPSGYFGAEDIAQRILRAMELDLESAGE
ncbi:MAG: hypothetical protein KatS3mg109_0400 [Pirellulaceae bacterium]|nr:MAG: hypothetical protein KatS3mg109_0400 [Pirellulaceae bacterium]